MSKTRKPELCKRRVPGIMLILGTMLLSCPGWSEDGTGAETKVRHWHYAAPPYGTPEIPRPPDEEFLKLLPPLRPEPEFDKKTRDLGIALWWGDYSVQLFSEQPPLPADLKRKAIVQTPAGEDEPLVLGLWGIKNAGPVTLTVKQTPFPITIRRVDFWPRHIPQAHSDLNKLGFDGSPVEGGREVGIATYLFEENTAEVSAGANTVFWINISIPAAATPGKYTATLELTVPENDRPIHLPITIQVLNYRLPGADIAYGMYFPTHQLPARYRTPEWLRTYWRDLAGHGMTSIAMYNYGGDIHTADGTPKFDGNPDIEMLKNMMKEGLVHPDIPIFWLSGTLGSFNCPTGTASPGAAGAVRDELKKQGLPEFLVYDPDEPTVNDTSLAILQNFQPLRKNFRLVTAISDYAAITYADLLDVWVLHGGLLTPEVRQLAAKKGAEVWTYDCSHRGAGNAPWSRYYAGLYTWALDCKGNFLWCYAESFTRENGKYRMGENDINWYPTHVYVLPGDKGLSPSIEWEARREGVEDYRTLRLLEKRIAANPENPVAREAVEWLNKTRSRVDWYLARNEPPYLYPWDGPEMYPMCPNFNPDELSGVRTKAIDYINRLQTE